MKTIGQMTGLTRQFVIGRTYAGLVRIVDMNRNRGIILTSEIDNPWSITVREILHDENGHEYLRVGKEKVSSWADY